jgi:spermidine synthase
MSGEARGMPFDRARASVVVFFYVSGACALIYEIAWTRMLTLVFGNTTFAVSTILSSFMMGLAIGSYFYGRYIDRKGAPIRTYGFMELGIALFAISFPALILLLTKQNILLSQLFSSYPLALRALQISIYFTILLVPASLMGATFPVVGKFVVERFSTLGARLGMLYAVNTLGAVSGCLIAGFLLIKHLGLDATTYVAAAANTAIALAAFRLSAWVGEGPSRSPSAAAAGRASGEGGLGSIYSERVAGYTAFGFGISGFCALAYQVLWMRILVFFTGVTTYAFSAMLATFLTGIALGSLLMMRLIDSRRDLVRWLATCQFGIGAFAYLSIAFLEHRTEFGFDRLLRAELGFGFGMGASWATFLWQLFGNSVLIMAIPTLLMGASFPLAGRICARSVATTGESIGGIYSVNSLGSALGSLVAGFAIVPWLGMERGIAAVALLNMLVAVFLSLHAPTPARGHRYGVVALSVCLGLFAIQKTFLAPSTLLRDVLLEDVRRAIPGHWSAERHSEGLTSTVTVLRNGTGGPRYLYLDAFESAGTSSTYKYMSLLGHLPMLLHQDPKEVLVIAFGTGTTSGAVAMHEFERLDVVEIESAVLDSASLFAAVNRNVLEDPRTRTIIDDGRNHVLTTKQRYDVITLEPLLPYFPAAVHLYTRDFYELSLARLKPGGVVCQWLPNHSQSLADFKELLTAFVEAFPYAYVWDIEGASAFIGSNEALALDLAKLRQGIARSRVRADLDQVRFGSAESLLSHLIVEGEAARRFAGPSRPVTDDRPSVEFFSVPRKRFVVYQYNVLSQLYQQRSDPVALLEAQPDEEFVASLEAESRSLLQRRRGLLSRIAEVRGVLGELEPLFQVKVRPTKSPLLVDRSDRRPLKATRARAGEVYGVISESDDHFQVRLDQRSDVSLVWIPKDAVEILR